MTEATATPASTEVFCLRCETHYAAGFVNGTTCRRIVDGEPCTGLLALVMDVTVEEVTDEPIPGAVLPAGFAARPDLAGGKQEQFCRRCAGGRDGVQHPA
jgi:hypothetical protein